MGECGRGERETEMRREICNSKEKSKYIKEEEGKQNGKH